MTTEHKREIRKREYDESYCAEPTCEFFGERVQQGVCHTTEPDVADLEKIDKHITELAEGLLDIRKNHYPNAEDYIPWLEAHYECAMVNWAFGLDECIRLRREVALLKMKLAKLESK